jgi:hypothetical protein
MQFCPFRGLGSNSVTNELTSNAYISFMVILGKQVRRKRSCNAGKANDSYLKKKKE